MLANVLKQNRLDPRLSYVKQFQNGRRIGIFFRYSGNWPKASYEEMNSALLALHHAGYIVYGASAITLKERLFEEASGG
jgi:hypothetical protein